MRAPRPNSSVADMEPERRSEIDEQNRERIAPNTAGGSPAGAATATPPAAAEPQSALAVRLEQLRAFYGDAEAVKGIDLEFRANQVTAIIGPSGCGKSTMIRCINRMHEEIPGAHAEGRVLLEDLDVYDQSVDVVGVRRAIGMVFQKPTRFRRCRSTTTSPRGCA
jgi:phosphate transport system ATP-binding protein